jgi:hypothetical protein
MDRQNSLLARGLVHPTVLRNRNAKERHTLNIPSNEFSLQGEIAPKLLNKLTGHLENKK